jgi:hypothetical protein
VAADKDGSRFGRLKTAGNGTLQLVVDYVKQETLEPLKGLGRFLLFGVIGSVFLGIGLVILAVSFLRFLQGETDGAFDGNLSWIPYLIVSVVVVAVAAAAVLMIQRGAARRQGAANAVDKEAA